MRIVRSTTRANSWHATVFRRARDRLGPRVRDRRQDRRHRALRLGHHSARRIPISGAGRSVGLGQRAALFVDGEPQSVAAAWVSVLRAHFAAADRDPALQRQNRRSYRARVRAWERLTSGVRLLRPWWTGASIRLSWLDGPGAQGADRLLDRWTDAAAPVCRPGAARMGGRRQPRPTGGRVGWPGALALRARGARARARSRGPCGRRCSRRPPAGRRWARCPLRA